jgi:hypothetical protein
MLLPLRALLLVCSSSYEIERKIVIEWYLLCFLLLWLWFVVCCDCLIWSVLWWWLSLLVCIFIILRQWYMPKLWWTCFQHYSDSSNMQPPRNSDSCWKSSKCQVSEINFHPYCDQLTKRKTLSRKPPRGGTCVLPPWSCMCATTKGGICVT